MRLMSPHPLSVRQRSKRSVLALGVLVLLSGCATGTPMGRLIVHPPTNHRAPTRYAQSMNSAVDGCLRNPGCIAAAPGDEAVIPWLSRAVGAVRTIVSFKELLDAAEVARVEYILVECARDANFRVNDADEELKGKAPTEEQCNQVVRQENGKDVTRAMELGNKKHALALECAQRELGGVIPGNFTVQPRYKYDPQVGRWQRLDPELVAEWLRNRLFDLLLGTLVPDIVVHASDNPHKVQRVYDFKFPCVPGRKSAPQWRPYPKGHPHHPRNQQQMYKDALGGEQDPALVTPQLGVQ